MHCCLTTALRYRLNTTLVLVLLKFMGERNPLLLICPWEAIVSALSHKTTSWCTCVFLGALPCKHGLAENCGIWDQSLGQNSSGGRSWTEPATEQWGFLWETSSVLQRAWPWGKAELRKELRWCWAVLGGKESVFETLGLQNQQLADWAGLAVVPESTAFTLSSLCPLPCKALKLWERWFFLSYLGFFSGFFFWWCLCK